MAEIPRLVCFPSVRQFLLIAALCWAPLERSALAGPPYTTDDPEPVDYQHWEVYFASQLAHDSGGWSGTAPHVEINYGVVPDVQLHLIAPAAVVGPAHGPTQYGYGDTELGTKVRFVQESTWRPQIGSFPLVEIPTGDHRRGLGSGHVQAFLPVWLQKSVGPWTTYGGGGYWLNPGNGNRNWGFLGWQVQRQIRSDLSVGAEVFHETPQENHGEPETRFDIGLVFDFGETHHLLCSAGRGLQGPNEVQIYLAYQLTFGPGAR